MRKIEEGSDSTNLTDFKNEKILSKKTQLMKKLATDVKKHEVHSPQKHRQTDSSNSKLLEKFVVLDDLEFLKSNISPDSKILEKFV